MSNGNAGFSIPGIYQPNILERVGAILQGQKDPIYQAQALDIEQKMGMMRFQQGQEELGIKKKAGEREEAKGEREIVKDFFTMLVKSRMPTDKATEVWRSFMQSAPAAKSYYRGVKPEEISIFPEQKAQEITRHYSKQELEAMNYPGPPGMYTVKGEPTAKGFRVIESIKPVKETEKVPNKLALQTFVGSEGQVKSEGLPEGITLPQATKILKDIQEQEIRIAAQQGAAGLTGKAEAEERIRQSRPVPPDVSRIIGLQRPLTVGEAEKLGINVPEPKTRQELSEQKAFTQRAIEGATLLENTIRNQPASIGVSGLFARITNNLIAQSQNFARIAGIPINASLDPKDYAKTFKDIGIKSASAQAQAIGLAYTAAISTGQSGRSISDNDVDLNLRRFGGNFQDPVAAIAVLRQFKQELNANYSRKVESFVGAKPPSFLDNPAKIKARAALRAAISGGQIKKSADAINFLMQQGIERSEAEEMLKED